MATTLRDLSDEVKQLKANRKRPLAEAEDTDNDEVKPSLIFSDLTYGRMAIFFASASVDNHGSLIAISPAVLLENFQTAIRCNTSQTANLLLSAYEDQRNDLETGQTQHFLAKGAGTGSFTPYPILYTYFLQGSIMRDSLPVSEQNVNVLADEVALLHFAPFKSESDLQLIQRSITDDKHEKLVQQPTRHIHKKNTKLFHNTDFDLDINSIVTTISNFFVVARTIVSVTAWGTHDENPYIINSLALIAEKITSRGFVSTLSQLRFTHPHLPHSIYAHIHAIFAEFAKLVKGKSLIEQYLKTGIIPVEAFHRVATTVDSVLSTLDSFDSAGASISAIFAYPLASYKVFHPDPDPQDGWRGARGNPGRGFGGASRGFGGRGQGAGRGRGPMAGRGFDPNFKPAPHEFNKANPHTIGNWLKQVSPGAPWSTYLCGPAGRGPNFCLKFALTDATCTLEGNCPRPHWGYNDLPATDKAALVQFIESTDGKKLLALA